MMKIGKRNDMVLNTFHLFAGAVGGIIADQLLGHRVVGAVEIEAYPRKVLLARQLDGSLPRFPIWDDVTTFRSDNPECASYIARLRALPNLCISGGFPCQDISAEGKGAGITGERSGLWGEFARIISEIMPEYVFVENSPMLTVRGLGTVLRDLADIGFNAEWGVLVTSAVGGHCEGKRIWIVAKASTSGWTEMVCSKSRRSQKKNCRWPTNDAYPHSLIDRIRALEQVAGEPAILGSHDGMADRVDRLHAIGNGQAPRVAATAFNLLRDRFE